MSATAEVGFFCILLVYALTGLTYNFKAMDEFMFTIWIAYFLFSFRLDKNARRKIGFCWQEAIDLAQQ